MPDEMILPYLVRDVAQVHSQRRLLGWPRPSWTPRTNREPDSTVFDAGDVDMFAASIEGSADPDAINIMLQDAAVADLDADAAEDIDGDRARASFMRDYAKMVRLACRVASWNTEVTQASTPRRPGHLPPRLDAAAIKSQIDLPSYIDQHVRLVKAGHDRFVGICPFHDDRNPSMSVWADGRWKCFACNAGGDVFEFAMRWHKCGFSEALQIINGGQCGH